MSDLAPFVAAALRDKVIADLMEENDKLSKQLRQCRAVEITGPEGEPVYARAQLNKGGADRLNPNAWCVPFCDQVLPCPLSVLADIEIRLGGVCKAIFSGNSVPEGFLDADEKDDENGKVANFYFEGSELSELWLDIKVQGWPEVRWRAAMNEKLNSEELLGYLIKDVAPELPETTVRFLGVCFDGRSVKGAVEACLLEQRKEEEAGEK